MYRYQTIMPEEYIYDAVNVLITADAIKMKNKMR